MIFLNLENIDCVVEDIYNKYVNLKQIDFSSKTEDLLELLYVCEGCTIMNVNVRKAYFDLIYTSSYQNGIKKTNIRIYYDPKTGIIFNESELSKFNFFNIKVNEDITLEELINILRNKKIPNLDFSILSKIFSQHTLNIQIRQYVLNLVLTRIQMKHDDVTALHFIDDIYNEYEYFKVSEDNQIRLKLIRE